MSGKRLVVPDGMLKTAVDAVRDRSEFGFHFLDNKDEERVVAQTRDTLEAAIRWLLDRLPLPSIASPLYQGPEWATGWNLGVDAVRQKFLATVPEIPEEVRPLLRMDIMGDWVKIHTAIIEAYRLGKESK